MVYDIFYVSANLVNPNDWKQFRERFPTAQKIENVRSIDDIKKKSFTKFFWLVWDDVDVSSDFKFDYRIDVWDEEYIHTFKHLYQGEESYISGIALIPKKATVLKKEFDFRFYVNNKKIDIVASKLKKYDIVFISYNEPTADKNFEKLKAAFPRAIRVHGVKGIHQAHIAAANCTYTNMFWVVDGDAIIEDQFNFDYEVSVYEKDVVHVWHSKNPINDLVYGYGGVKLLPRNLTLNMDLSKPDMTTSISSKFKVVKEVSNVTAFNTDPFNTWKSAFRECTKLASKTIDRQDDKETVQRLDVWCSTGKDRLFGEYAIAGAIAGRQYGTDNFGNIEALKKINDFDWLLDQFRSSSFLS
jgi:hypothetical protein